MRFIFEYNIYVLLLLMYELDIVFLQVSKTKNI